MTMGFFDFLFKKSSSESYATQPLSPIEQVVKESVEHLKKCLGSLTSEKLEAEAINLASYIFLRKGINRKCFFWRLCCCGQSFFTDDKIR